MPELTLGQLRNTKLSQLYYKLIKNESLSDKEIQIIYQLAIIFLNKGDKHVKKFGYKMLLKASLSKYNYQAIYDISINLGYYPITELINRTFDFSENFITMINSSFLENFNRDGIYYTEQQNEMINLFKENNDKTVTVVAPTSYGKSELIMNLIADNKIANICIIVPTKALLSQTKKRILKSKEYSSDRKIITHPDMYQNTDRNFIAVLTQERLMRLLEKEPSLYFDISIIDEAHNLFVNDIRNKLLASSIAVLYKRNQNIIYKFLSPFLIDANNLNVYHCEYEIIEQRINENLKINNYYSVDVSDELEMYAYDQFLNNFIKIKDVLRNSEIDFIEEYASNKNIVYLNSPPKLENVANILSERITIDISSRLSKACDEISKYLHRDYKLVNCLKKGVVYHHGSVPDIVKLYIEDLYAKIKELKYIVCSSTLLEGVNIPAEKLFLLDYKKGPGRLTASQFKNLSGRICRFSELFDKDNNNLKLLEPDIYVIKSKYTQTNANIKKFLQETIKEDKKISDDPKNVLLKNTEITDENIDDFYNENEFLANFEPGIEVSGKIKIASTDIGKLCFKNNIKEFDVIQNELLLHENISILEETGTKAASAIEVIDMINIVFLEFVKENDNNQNLLRLRQESARSFYAMFLSWLMRSAPYSELINRFLAYWKRISKNKEHDGLIYVGRWGDIKRGGHKPLWINIREKDEYERVNYAILRIKEEQDFVENTIVKFVEVLNDLYLIEDDIYKKIKYGTSENIAIIMIKNGYSNSLAKLLIRKYRDFLEVNIEKNIVITKPEIISAMKENNENDIYIFETQFNVKSSE